MVEVLKVMHEAERALCLDKLGMANDAALFLFAAHEDGEIIGVCAYQLGEGEAELTGLWVDNDQDILLKQLCVRAVLNSIDLNGIRQVYAAPSFDEILMRSLRFEVAEPGERSGWQIDLTGYFDAACASEYKAK